MVLLPNIYYHARTPATSGSSEYTFSRLADATASQNRGLKTQKPHITRVNKATRDGSQRDPRVNHGYMVLVDGLQPVEWIDSEFATEASRANRYARPGHRPSGSSHQARGSPTGTPYGVNSRFQFPHKASPRRVNHRLLVTRPTTTQEENPRYSYCGGSVGTTETHMCYHGHVCHDPQYPCFSSSPPMDLAFYPDTVPQPMEISPPSPRAQAQHSGKQSRCRDNAWELDSNSDGGVPLDDSQDEDAIISERIIPSGDGRDEKIQGIVRVIENLQAGYLADTEDGGNGYDTYDDEDYYSKDDGCGDGDGEDSDDTIRGVYSCV